MCVADPQAKGDERLPLRWAVILLTTVGAGAVAGLLAGPLAAIGTVIAVLGLLAVIVGH